MRLRNRNTEFKKIYFFIKDPDFYNKSDPDPVKSRPDSRTASRVSQRGVSPHFLYRLGARSQQIY